MKRRVWPVSNAAHQPVLDGIDVAILNMTSVVGFVTDQMLPKTTLPNAAFLARFVRRAASFIHGQRLSEASLDQARSCREIRIVGRQREHGMYVVRQDHERVDFEPRALPRRGHCIAQHLDMIDEECRPSVVQIDCEEPAPAWHLGTTIVRHAGRVAARTDRLQRAVRRITALRASSALRLIRPTTQRGQQVAGTLLYWMHTLARGVSQTLSRRTIDPVRK